MDTPQAKKLSAIITKESDLELVITELTQKTIAQHDISVQGSPDEILAGLGKQYLKPNIIQNHNNAPRAEPFLQDDYGWLLGFSISLPMFIGIIIGAFIIGDLQSTKDNFYYGTLGGLTGLALGVFIASLIRVQRKKRVTKQEKKGGFVLWITIRDNNQLDAVKTILTNYQAKNITIS